MFLIAKLRPREGKGHALARPAGGTTCLHSHVPEEEKTHPRGMLVQDSRDLEGGLSTVSSFIVTKAYLLCVFDLVA